MPNEPSGATKGLNVPIAGTWHLLGEGDDEINIPDHRMDLILRGQAGQLRGAVISRVNGDELPIIKSVTFDGDILRLQMAAPPSEHQDTVLVMRSAGDRLEGNWIQGATPVGPRVKLVRRRPSGVEDVSHAEIGG
jgi:hypothetical protein